MAASAFPPEAGATAGVSPPGRLTRRAEFLAVANGRRVRTPRMTIMALARPTADPLARTPAPQGLRIGFTVTRKIGHATERNRIRRRLRAAAVEAAAAQAAAAAREADIDVVIVARREAISAPYGTLVADLTRALPDLLRTINRTPHQQGPERTVR